MTNFSIKDLAEFSGIKPHTIRIWEQRFSFLQPKRNETFRRLYTPEELNVLLDISLLNQSGYSVSRIARMTDEEKAQVVSKMNALQQELKAVNELIIFMAEMDAERFETVLDNCILCLGIHDTIQLIIIPFAEKVGLFQKLDNKNYYENIYLIKEIVKRKIQAGIEKASINKESDKTILLFLPPGEQQELSLLYICYLAKMEGFKILYLGKHISVDILLKIIRFIKPNFVITQILEKYSYRDLITFIKNMPEDSPHTEFINIGYSLSLNVQSNHYKEVKNTSEVMDILSAK